VRKFAALTHFACQLNNALHILFEGPSRPRSVILQPKVHTGRLNAEGFRFAIVVSRWNDFLTSRLVDGAIDALESLGVSEDSVEIFKVPGSFELPLTALKAAESGKFDAVIALGVVIRGETPHFDYVAGEAASGISRASVQTGIPISFGVITANTVEQAINRAGAKSGNKGYEAALAAVEIVNLHKSMEGRKTAAQTK
jgi:6,7-dimethyl-8-ribityllumazine synthase